MWVYTFIKLWKSINRSQLDLSLLMLTGFHYQLSPFQIADTSLYSNKMTHKSEEVLNEPPQNVSLWLGILSWGQLLRQKVPEASHYVSPCAAHSRSIVSDSVTPWTVAHQTPLSTGILQTRLLEWVAMPSSKGPSQPRDQTQVSHIAGRFFTSWATRESPCQPLFNPYSFHPFNLQIFVSLLFLA